MQEIAMLVVIFLTSLAYVLFSLLVRRRLTNMEKMKAIQEKMKEHNKLLADAIKRKDEKKMKMLEAEQAKIMPEMMKSTLEQMKPMIIILPVFILLFGFVKTTFGFYYMWLGVGIPFLHEPVVWIAPDLFFLFVIPLGIILGMVVNRSIKPKKEGK